ncbi:MAG: D-aminoacylase [Lentisphaerae bacterium]|nr:D-aminoacylase [Lentisphaerota bacterium]
MFSIKITNGLVYDGSGKTGTFGDIGIADDKIVDIGDLSSAETEITIDAQGHMVCPGFIDAHSHSDAYLLIEPSAHSKIYQGITTEIVGNCGASAAPLVGEYHMPSDWLDKKYPGTWSSVAEYRKLLENIRPAPNVVLLIGHNTLRVAAAGYENRPVTESELSVMIRLFEQSLDEGGRGLSTGLIYTPASSASREEIVALALVAASRNGIYASHMRSEGSRLIEAIEETIAIAQEAEIRTEISHLKTAGKKNWGLIDNALETIARARDAGVEIAADRYPYTASSTDLDMIFPVWAEEGGRKSALERLKNDANRARLRSELLQSHTDDYWDSITIGSTHNPANRRFQGCVLTNAAKQLGMHPVDAALYFAETDELCTGAFFGGMSESNMLRILAQEYVMLGTDASLRAPTGPLSEDYPHPRAYGSFPKFLRMALDGKTVAVEEAIRKMTSLPASHFRLTNRGRIEKGCFADIVVLNQDIVSDRASYAAPHQLAVGIEHVLINGTLTVANGVLTGSRAGRML